MHKENRAETQFPRWFLCLSARVSPTVCHKKPIPCIPSLGCRGSLYPLPPHPPRNAGRGWQSHLKNKLTDTHSLGLGSNFFNLTLVPIPPTWANQMSSTSETGHSLCYYVAIRFLFCHTAYSPVCSGLVNFVPILPNIQFLSPQTWFTRILNWPTNRGIQFPYN